MIFTQAVAVRRDVLERVNGFNEDMDLLEDYELALRLSLEGPWGYIRDPLVHYHWGSPGSLAAAAESDQQRVTTCSLAARQRLYHLVNDSASHKHLRKPVYRAVRTLQRESRALHLVQRAKWPLSMLGWLMLQVNRYRRALYRRSPWFPQMRVFDVTST